MTASELWAKDVRDAIATGLCALGLIPTLERVDIVTCGLLVIFERFPEHRFHDRDVNALIAAGCVTAWEIEHKLATIIARAEA